MATPLFPVFDFHSDLLSRLLEEPIEGFAKGRGAGPERHYDLPRLRAGGVRAVVCALFTRDGRLEHPVVRTLRMIDIAERLAAMHGDAVGIARSAAELDRLHAAGRTALVLSIENGIACLDRVELLRTYYRLGVRAMGLVWNGRNEIADGSGEEEAGSKLTAFGREVLAEMERLGMIVDVSHLSEAGFWDVVDRARRPIIASHSNARALCDHRRNLKDEQLRAVARSGGVVGVNFYAGFLNPEAGAAEKPPKASLADVVRHVNGLVERAGIDHVGIGSDYDGIDEWPSGLEEPSRFPALAEALRAAGYTEPDVRKIFFENFLRVFRAVCG